MPKAIKKLKGASRRAASSTSATTRAKYKQVNDSHNVPGITSTSSPGPCKKRATKDGCSGIPKAPSKRTVREWEAIVQQRLQEAQDEKDIRLKEAIQERDSLRQDLEYEREEAKRDKELLRRKLENEREEARRDKDFLRRELEYVREEARRNEETLHRDLDHVREEAQRDQESLRLAHQTLREGVGDYLESLRAISSQSQLLSSISLEAELLHNVNIVQLQAFFKLYQRFSCQQMIP